MSLNLLIDSALGGNYWILVFCFAFGYHLIFKNDIYNFFDPLSLAIITLSTSSALVTRLLLTTAIQEKYFFCYWACNIALLIGFKHRKRKVRKTSLHILKKSFHMRHLFVFLLVISVIHFSMTTYIFLTIGLAIFTDNPSESRVGMSAAFKWGNIVLEGSRTTGLLTSIFLASYYTGNNARKILCSILAVGFILSFLSIGNKSAVFDIAFIIGGYLVYIKSIGIQIPKVMNYAVYILVGLGFSYFSYAAAVDSQSSSGIDKFLTRIALSGDSYLYFFVDNLYDTLKYTYNPITYLLHIVTSAFGIKLIENNLGVRIYGLSTGDYDSGFGPNPQYVVEGMIFFGMYLAPLYAYVIGYLFKYLREISIGESGNYSFLLSTIFLSRAGTVLIDINMSTYNFISCILIVTLSYMAANLFLGYKIFSLHNDGELC